MAPKFLPTLGISSGLIPLEALRKLLAEFREYPQLIGMSRCYSVAVYKLNSVRKYKIRDDFSRPNPFSQSMVSASLLELSGLDVMPSSFAARISPCQKAHF